MKIKRYLSTVVSICALVNPFVAGAQSWPDRTITVVVPYPPGGPTDIVARVVSQELSEHFKKPVIVENKAGAGGNIGADYVARSNPDGYTLLIATTAHAINMSLFSNLNYDTLTSFEPVSLLTQGPLLLAARKDLPVSNVQELIELATSKPGQLSFASSGNGQSTHLSAELFNSLANTKMVHVPYRGSAPALVDLVGGQVDIMFDPILSVSGQVKSGAVKALAITGSKRSDIFPDVPTIHESGVEGYEATAWNGILVPAGTPESIINELNAALKTILADEAVKDKFASQGFDAQWLSNADFKDYVELEVTKWKQVVEDSGATVN